MRGICCDEMHAHWRIREDRRGGAGRGRDTYRGIAARVYLLLSYVYLSARSPNGPNLSLPLKNLVVGSIILFSSHTSTYDFICEPKAGVVTAATRLLFFHGIEMRGCFVNSLSSEAFVAC